MGDGTQRRRTRWPVSPGRWGTALIGIVMTLACSAPLATVLTDPIDAAGATVPASVPDACQLLKPQELQAVFGGVISAGTPQPYPDRTFCEWTYSPDGNPNSPRGFQLQLEVHPDLTPAAFREARANKARLKIRAIRHLGDAAFIAQGRDHGIFDDNLGVRQGHVAFFLDVLKNVGTQRLERLARIVSARV